MKTNHTHTCGHCCGKSEKISSFKILCLSAGAFLFIAGLIIENIFLINKNLILAIFITAYLLLGADIVYRALKNIIHGKIFDENFLMTVATTGAFAIGQNAEAVAVMLFYQIGEFFQEMAVNNAKKSIAKLMDIRPDFANIKKGDNFIKVLPTDVKIGDLIVVKAGEKIPLDGVVLEGESFLDSSALTGESVPHKVKVGDTVLSGSINQNAILTIKVTKPFGESTVSKILDLIENTSKKKASTENFISKFAKVYTPVTVGLATCIAIIPCLFFGGVLAEWIHRALIFLVISCPCALVISIPLGFFGGIGAASKNGVLIKGSNFLEALNYVDSVVFDKTGTLTKGVFKVTKLEPSDSYSKQQLIELASKAEAFSGHPIALSIMQEFGEKVNKKLIKNYTEQAGLGISVVCDKNVILAGNAKLMEKNNVNFIKSESVGTKVYVAENNVFAGCIIISDEIKTGSKMAIKTLKNKGVKRIAMLTGDSWEIAQDVAIKLEIDEVFSELLPQDKVEKINLIKKQNQGKLAYVGDGINDAPVLALADIGIAMGGLGSDAAIEAADIVLMTDEIKKLATAKDIAKFTQRVVWQNIFFALSIKAIFLIMGAFGVATMWEAVFADVGVALLSVCNALRIIKKKFK